MADATYALNSRLLTRYLRHLSATRLPLNPVEEFAQGYEDFLQAPLQVSQKMML